MFKIGDKVRCVNNIEDRCIFTAFTIGKTYLVHYVFEPDIIAVVNDEGFAYVVSANRFERVKSSTLWNRIKARWINFIYG